MLLQSFLLFSILFIYLYVFYFDKQTQARNAELINTLRNDKCVAQDFFETQLKAKEDHIKLLEHQLYKLYEKALD